MLKTITARHISMNKKQKYKSVCVVDTVIRMWNVDNNHQKYDKIAILGISEDDENILGETKSIEEVLNLADERLYIIPTINK